MVQQEKNFENVFSALNAPNTQCENRSEQVKAMLEVSFGRWLSSGLMFLLEHVDEQVRTAFVSTYLASEQLAAQARVTVVVRSTPATLKRTGNIGRYVIYLRWPDGDEQLVHFTHQVSTIYYLLFLIQRKQHEGFLFPLSLQRNAKAFQTLYLAVYDNILPATVVSRYQGLLYRECDKGVRAGRANEVVNDVRRHLKTLFAPHDESFFPYAMTAHEHLTLPPSNIVFEGDATQLLQHDVL